MPPRFPPEACLTPPAHTRAAMHAAHAIGQPAGVCARAIAAALIGLPLLQAPAAFAQTQPETVLPAVDVSAGGDRDSSGYAGLRSRTATRTDTPLRDVPQSVTVITEELIRDQAMQGIADVLRYVPGVGIAQGEGNRDAAVFRGSSSTGDFFVDGMRDDVQYYRDLYNIDRVEVLKGPNAMIFGRGGSGGVINRVTRQPVWEDINEFSLQAGSWSQRRATADIGRPINERAAFRINGMFEDSDGYRQFFHLRRYGINPTLALDPGERTRIRLGYEHFKDERTADRGVPSFQGRPVDTDPSTFFGNPDPSRAEARVDAFTAAIDHDFGNGLKLRNQTRHADYDRFYQNVFPGAVNAAGTTVSIAAYNSRTERSNFFNQTDLHYSLRTGSVRHTLLGGVEIGRQVSDNFRNTGYFASIGPAVTSVQVPLASPLTGLPVTFRQSASDADNHGTANILALYLQDQIEFSPHWQAIVGLRHERFGMDFRNNRNGSTISTTDKLLSPRLGLVYKPVQPLSFYASYSIAYVPRAGDQLSSLTLSNRALDPEKFRNLELGAKWDIHRKLAATAAIYQLDRSNVAVPDPNDPTQSILVDGQRVKGLELGLAGSITPSWRLIGGYAWQDGHITRTQSATVQAGNRLASVPRHSFSLWNRYDFDASWGAGLGVIYQSDMFAAADNAVTLPGFTRVDAAVYYALNRTLQLQLNLENLFDRRYYASAHSNNNIMPGSPRAIRVEMNLRF